MTMSPLELLPRIQGSIFGHTIGDRLGWPYETLSPDKIVLQKSPGGPMQFTDAPTHALSQMRKLQPGDATDDTQHSIALLESLIRYKRFSPEGFSLDLIRELERFGPVGWGQTSIDSVEEMAAFYRSGGELGRGPFTPAEFVPGKGTGNGVAMKAHILGLFHSVSEIFIYPYSGLCKDILAMGALTHGDPRASHAAFVLAALVGEAIQTPTNRSLSARELKGKIGYLASLAKVAEDMTADQRSYSAEEQSVLKDSVSGRLEKLSLNTDAFVVPEGIAALTGTGCFALESVLFSLIMFLRYPADFVGGMEAVITMGGDTDTNAAMYGALAGANLGIEAIPREWLKIPKGADLVAAVSKFHTAACRYHP